MTDAGRPLAGDQARVSVLVEVPLAETFRIFSEEIDQWWQRGFKYRVAGSHRGILHLEPCVGGKLFETFVTDAGERTVQTGTVTAWEPPRRLAFEWRAVNFAPDERTHVEVTFADSAGKTLVTVTHSGWSKIRPDHPARHGLAVPAFIRMMGLWWGELMTGLRRHAQVAALSRSG